MMIADTHLIADEIIELYSHHGGEEYAGEKVTQLEHMVQAAQLAEQQGYDEEVILAAFLHDIGHICEAAHGDNEMDGFGIKDHEDAGADFLRRRGFSERLIRLVQSHVGAKRYLTYKYPSYYEQLSEASKKTLEYQGGRMVAGEAMDYEKQPLFDLIIQMRRWDDEAKLLGKPVPDLDKYRQMIIRHLGGNQKEINHK
jgi:phosphonate degradation associated HDIG domain protein